MPTTSAGGRLLALAQEYRDALEGGNQAAVNEMTRAWAIAVERVELEIQTLASKMEAARLAGVDVSPAWLYQGQRLTEFLESATEALARWAPMAEETIRRNAYQAALSAQADARLLAQSAADLSLPGVVASFTDLDPDTMATILGHLAPGGPLRDLLAGLAPMMADAAADAVVQGVVLGKGTDWIATQLRQALDIPRWRAETIARTEALRAYRETSRQTYLRSNVVGSWVWTSALDRRTCPACMVLHGQEFPLTATLDGHPRCRCAMIPKTLSWADIGPEFADLPDTAPVIELGSEWFGRQDAATQKAVLGPLKHGLWASGQISLDDLVARTYSPEWGTMRRERSVREILEGRHADYRDRVA